MRTQRCAENAEETDYRSRSLVLRASCFVPLRPFGRPLGVFAVQSVSAPSQHQAGVRRQPEELLADGVRRPIAASPTRRSDRRRRRGVGRTARRGTARPRRRPPPPSRRSDSPPPCAAASSRASRDRGRPSSTSCRCDMGTPCRASTASIAATASGWRRPPGSAADSDTTYPRPAPRSRHDDMADGDLRIEDARAAAGDELPAAVRDHFFEDNAAASGAPTPG